MNLRTSSVAGRASEQCAERTDWGQNHIGLFLYIWLCCWLFNLSQLIMIMKCDIAKHSKLLFLLVIINTNASLPMVAIVILLLELLITVAT